MSETPSREDAAAKRRAAAQREHVDALLVERRGYVLRNLPDRIAQVDAELERAGHAAPKPKRGAK